MEVNLTATGEASHHFIFSMPFVHPEVLLQVGLDGELAAAERAHEGLRAFVHYLESIKLYIKISVLANKKLTKTFGEASDSSLTGLIFKGPALLVRP